MKATWCLALLALAFLTAENCAAEVPSLLGNWTGYWSAYDRGDGFSATENGSLTLTFVEQEGRIFTGNMTLTLVDGAEIFEGFAGAIGPDDKSIYVAEYSGGYAQGTLLSDDEMDLIYLLDGENASVAVDKLYRIGAIAS
jgi:hypothetical protein